MFNLIKTDLKRIFKDKLFLIICIIGGVFGIVTPLLFKLLTALPGLEDLSSLMLFDAKSLFFNSFSPSGDFGMVLPILVAIIIFKDFSQGTVRNKLICGKSRKQIFISTFISSTVMLCGLILAYALFTLAFSLIFFNFQSTPFATSDLLYLLLTILFKLLIYLFISALISFLCVFMKNAGVTIVVYIALLFVLSLVDGLIVMGISSLNVSGLNPTLNQVLTAISKMNVFGTSFPAGNVDVYKLSDILFILLPTVIGSTLFVVLGIVVFDKKDLK